MYEPVAITYTGPKTIFLAKCGPRNYEFEWQKSLGIGKRTQEVRPQDAQILATMRDKKGRKLFVLEANSIITKED